MRRARSLTIAARLLDALLLAVVGVVLACVVLVALGPRLGHPSLVIRGASMQPAIPLGSLVVLEPGVPADLRVGDVVAFQATNATTVTHRVTRLASLGPTPYFGTKGDANAEADPLITPVSAIIGRVSLVVPGAGYLLTVLAAPIGIAAVFLVTATLLTLTLLLEEMAIELRPAPRRFRRPIRARSHPASLPASFLPGR